MDDLTVQMIIEWLHKNKGLIEARRQAEKLNKGVKGLRRNIKQGFQQALRYVDNFAAGLARTGKRLMLIGTLGIAALGALVVKTSQAGAKLEEYRVTLNQLYMDEKKAGEAMEWIMGMQVKTPYTPDELLGALKPLKVFGMDAKKWLPAIGDMASTMGKDIKDAATGVAKAFSAGQAGADALRESYGVTMANLVKVSGYTEKELRTDMEKYRDALFTFITDPKFAGGMKRYAATWKGVLSSIKGGLQTFVMYAGREINNVMKQDFKKVVDWIVKAYESGKLQAWAKRVAEGFKMIWQGLKKAGQVLWKFIKPVVNFFREHPKMLKWAVSAVAAGTALTLLGGGIMTLTGKLWKLGRGLVGGIGRLKRFGGTLRGLFTNVKAAGGISGLLAGKGGILGGIGQLAGGIGGKMGGGLGALLGKGGAAGGAAAGGGILGSLGTILPILGAVIGGVALFATAWKKNFSGIREATQKAFSPLFGKSGKILSIGQMIGKVWGFIKKLWEGLAKALAPVFKAVIQILGVIIRIGKLLWNALKPVLKILGGALFGALAAIGKVLEWIFTAIGKALEFILKPLGKATAWLDSLFGVFTGEPERRMAAISAEMDPLLRKWREHGNLTEDEKKRLRDLQVEYGKLAKEVQKFPKLRKWWEDTKKNIDKGMQRQRVANRLMFGSFDLLNKKMIASGKRFWDNMKDFEQRRVQGFKNAWKAIKDGAVQAFEKIKKALEPLKKHFEWFRDNVIVPVKNALRDLFKPLIEGFEKFRLWLAKALQNAPKAFTKMWGITEEELAGLKRYAQYGKITRGMGGVEGTKWDARGRFGQEGEGGDVAPPGPTDQDLAAAGAGGAGGGGGPSFHNHYVYFTFQDDAFKIFASDPEAIKKALRQVFTEQGLGYAAG